MVYLTWLYSIGILVTTIFVNIYVFKINDSVLESILYNSVFITACLFGFTIIGYLASIMQIDIKKLYYAAYLFFIFGFLSLFFLGADLLGVYMFSLAYGIGNGIFHCALHTQELKNIEDTNRDFYSSSINAGKSIIEVLVPAFVALAFFTGSMFNFDGYQLIFGVYPFIYLLSFLFIKDVSSYYAKKISKEDIQNFFNLKKYRFGHMFFFIDGFKWGTSIVILAIISIVLLKSELNIGIFQALLSLISTFLIMHLGMKRKEKNRLVYFGIFSFLVFLNYIFLGIYFTTLGFVIFSLTMLFLVPLFRVSHQVYNLRLMDNVKQGNSDFYPAMLMREIILWLGRFLALTSLYIMFINFNLSLEEFLRIGLVIIGFLFLLLFGAIYLWERYEK